MPEARAGEGSEGSWTSPGAGSPWSFAVGPSQLHPVVPDAVRRALAEGLPSWSHRSPAFRREVARTVEALAAVLEFPEGYRVLFLGSATEAMERIIHGAVEERSFHLLNGAFARRFRNVARNLGRTPDAFEVEDGRGFDLASIRVPDGCELLALTQNETSTGVALQGGAIQDLARRHPELLVAVDVVTAAPVLPLDLSAVDAAFFSVQKLFGLPAGLGVLVVSPRLVERARERMAAGGSVGGYLHLPALADAASRHETGATPNMLGIRLLGDVAERLAEEGMEEVRRRTSRKAGCLHQAAHRAGWSPFPPRSEDRSPTVLVFRAEAQAEARAKAQAKGGGKSERGESREVISASEGIRARLREQGFEVSLGYGAHRDTVVRIANFPAHSLQAVERLAGVLEGLE